MPKICYQPATNRNSSVRDIFAGTGLLSKHLPDYEPRPGQGEMAEAIHNLLTEIRDKEMATEEKATSLLIEAETGLGKTLAYLIPAALSDLKVVISTNTRNLQDQILKKDIPFVRKYIAPELRVTCVKGRQNYLCMYRWLQAVSSGQSEMFTNENKKKIADWIETSRHGDRSELGWLPQSSMLWNAICCQSHSCLNNDCPENQRCFLNRLRKDAAASQIILVNHHLFFSDLSVRQSGYGEVLPRYQAVIFDEAHHIEQIAGNFFGTSISLYQIRDLTLDIEQTATAELANSSAYHLSSQANIVLTRMNQLVSMFPRERGRLPLEEILDKNEQIFIKRDELIDALESMDRAIEEVGKGKPPWSQLSNRCHDFMARLKFIIKDNDIDKEENHNVHWVERSGINLTLSVTPINIANIMQKTLFANVAGCVFTSATLTTGGDFKYLLQRLGMDSNTKTLSFKSPFPYRENSRIYIPADDFPEPNAPAYKEKISAEIEKLIMAARGRAMVLFTSFSALETTWQALEDKIEYPLLKQGDMPRKMLLEEFKKQTDSVLFAVASFWEGVDIVGESLSLLIIDKLPFEVPSDPVMMAELAKIRSSGGNPFFEFQVPRAILTLRQGVGRLMRNSNDCGIIALLDIRLFSKGYGKKFVHSLPPAPIIRKIDEVKNFFEQIEKR